MTEIPMNYDENPQEALRVHHLMSLARACSEVSQALAFAHDYNLYGESFNEVIKQFHQWGTHMYATVQDKVPVGDELAGAIAEGDQSLAKLLDTEPRELDDEAALTLCMVLIAKDMGMDIKVIEDFLPNDPDIWGE